MSGTSDLTDVTELEGQVLVLVCWGTKRAGMVQEKGLVVDIGKYRAMSLLAII
jgi:hypothetical protein